MDSSVYANKDFVKASKRWVCVYASKDTGHGTKKVDGKEMCKLHPQLLCEDHVRADGQAGGKFFSGTIRTPATVWCDPEGKEIGKQQGSMSAKQLIEKMAEAEKKVGPGLGSDEYWMAQERNAAGEKLLGEGKLKEALEAFNAVVKLEKLPGSKPVVERAKAGLARVDEQGRSWLAQATEMKSAGDNVKAKAKLKEIVAALKGSEIAKEAEKMLAEMESAEKNKVKGGDPNDRR